MSTAVWTILVAASNVVSIAITAVLASRSARKSAQEATSASHSNATLEQVRWAAGLTASKSERERRLGVRMLERFDENLDLEQREQQVIDAAFESVLAADKAAVEAEPNLLVVYPDVGWYEGLSEPEEG